MPQILLKPPPPPSLTSIQNCNPIPKFILSFHKSLGRRLVSLIMRAGTGVCRGEGGSRGRGEVGKEEGKG